MMNRIARARRELAGRVCRQALMRAVNAAIGQPPDAAAARIAGELGRRGCRVEAALVPELLGRGFAPHQLERNAAEIRRLRWIVRKGPTQ
jgi:hypothetical protein